MCETGFFGKLPPEIMMQIFLYLDDSLDLIHCSSVCYRWREIINSDRIWNKQCSLIGIRGKPFLKIEDSLFLNLTKIYINVPDLSERMSVMCYWRSHFNRYVFLEHNWRTMNCTIRELDIGSENRHPDSRYYYLDRMLVIVNLNGIFVLLLDRKCDIPFWIQKKYPDAIVDNVLIKDGLLIYNQGRYVACFKRIDNQIQFLYEFFIEKNVCKSHTFLENFTLILMERLFLVMDNCNSCYLNFYKWETGKLIQVMNFHRHIGLAQDCPHIYCVTAYNDNVYLSYKSDSVHKISLYNYKLDQCIFTHDICLPAIELIASEKILCAKINMWENYALRVWSLPTFTEIILRVPGKFVHKYQPVIITADNRLIYINRKRCLIVYNLNELNHCKSINCQVQDMYLVCGKLLLVRQESILKLFDFNTSIPKMVKILLRKIVTNIMADDKAIILLSNKICKIMSFW